MPKKDGVVKTFSFSQETTKQINVLSKEYMLKPTNLLEYLINKEYKSITNKVKTTTEN